MTDHLTPEQEAQARRGWDSRRFDPASYEKEIMGPELPPDVQVAMAEHTLQAMDPAVAPVRREAQDREVLAAQQQQNDAIAQEFCFLDPADYVDQERTSTGKVLTPSQLLDKLQIQCKLTCWFALLSEAMIAKELNPRDVALAYRKIGQNPENLRQPERWDAAIAEVKQEEAGKQLMYNYERAALWCCRTSSTPRHQATYVTWVPCCWLREYSMVKFDDYGVPDWYIPGWRDVLLGLIRTRFLSEDTAKRVFGEAVGPRSRRYHMILAGLRNAREEQVHADVEVMSSGQGLSPDVTMETASNPCLECHHSFAHFLFCSQYQAWYKGLAGGEDHAAAGVTSGLKP